MSRRRRLCIATVAAVVVTHLASEPAFGDAVVPTPAAAAESVQRGFIRIKTCSRVATDGGSSLRLPPGIFLDDPSWTKRETELRRLQDLETRLTAENKSLRTTTSSWQPGWKTLTLVLVTGFAGGVYARGKL